MSNRAEYYKEQVRLEQAAAADTDDPAIRKIHLEIAEAYSRLAELELKNLDLSDDGTSVED
jgi:hypothetical protein